MARRDGHIPIDPEKVAAAYKVPTTAVHMIEPAVVRDPERCEHCKLWRNSEYWTHEAAGRYNDFVKQQAHISFKVHVGVFTSMQAAYKLCTADHAPDAFDVIVRTRPDAVLNGRAIARAVKTIKEQFAEGHKNLASGCVRQRSLVGGDFSDVAFVGTRQFWELFSRSFDVYSQYDYMYSRPCTKFQKGQVLDMTYQATRQGGSCCERTDCAQLFGELKKPCSVDTAPPCSFTPESFFRSWMNQNNVGVLPLDRSTVTIRDSQGTNYPVCTME